MFSTDAATELLRYTVDGANHDLRSIGYRFPIITTALPRNPYITAVVHDPHGVMLPSSIPTVSDLEMIGQFHAEHMRTYYNDAEWVDRMRATRLFDTDAGARKNTFIKHPNGGWGLLAVGEIGAQFSPGRNDLPTSLTEVLNYARKVVENFHRASAHV